MQQHMYRHSTPVKKPVPDLHIPPLDFPSESLETASAPTYTPGRLATLSAVQHPVPPYLQAWYPAHPVAWGFPPSSLPGALDHSSVARKLPTGDSSIIEKQQKELELLINELKDRDAELNDLVQLQQKQVAAWTEDRQKILQLEENYLQLRGSLEARDQEITQLQSNFAESQSLEQEKTAEIQTLEVKLQQCTAEKGAVVNQCKNLEAQRNRLELGERSLQAILAEKDAELQSYTLKLETGDAEMQAKLKDLQESIRDLEVQLRGSQERQRTGEMELERREGELLCVRQENERLQSQLAAASQQVEQLKSQLQLSDQCDKRKEQLLQLQRSKVERGTAELETLKKICSHQQHEIAMLMLKLQGRLSTLCCGTVNGTPAGAKQSPEDSRHIFSVVSHDGGRIATRANSGKSVDHRHPAARGDSSFTSVADQLFELHQKVRNSKHEAFTTPAPSTGNPYSSPTVGHHNRGHKDPEDVSFVPAADELSQLLDESSVERHLGRVEPTSYHSAPQMEGPASPINHSNTTHERGSVFGGHRQTLSAPQVHVSVAHETLASSAEAVLSSSVNQPSGGTAIGRDSWSGITSSETGTSDGIVSNSILQLPKPQNSKSTASSMSETGTKNDRPRLDPSSISQPKPDPDSEVTPKAKLKHWGKDDSLTGGAQEHTSSTAHSSVDVYHMALQVRDKLSAMFDSSAALEKPKGQSPCKTVTARNQPARTRSSRSHRAGRGKPPGTGAGGNTERDEGPRPPQGRGKGGSRHKGGTPARKCEVVTDDWIAASAEPVAKKPLQPAGMLNMKPSS